MKSVYVDSKNRNSIPQFEVAAARISYIKRPNRVCLGNYAHIDRNAQNQPIHCDIDSAFHRDIINIAVMLAAQSIQDQGASGFSDKNVKEDFMS